MRRPLLALTTAITLIAPAYAGAQTLPTQGAHTSNQGTPADPQTDTAAENDPAASDIVVTARRREERLQDVPIAVTAISGDAIKQQQLVLVRDVAAYTPGLNINSDSVGRAFVSIRGIGTTLIDTVQPGVGIFIDGIYQPNTTFLNSPLVDVARVEVLRGPQGTLFGNNTLGGAINVVTRQPSNEWEGRIDGALASGDNYRSLSGSVSGPIVEDVLQFRVGGAYHKEDGFQRNLLAGGDQNPLETKSVNGTLRFLPTSWARFTLNGGYDRVAGGATPYFNVRGPRDYTLDGSTNQRSLATIDYYAANLKGEFDVDSLNTTITAIGAYNQSDTRSEGDGDYSQLDFLRVTSERTLKTRTGEVRFDTKWSDNFSTLIGGFYARSTTDTSGTNTIVPANLTVPLAATAENENVAAFATGFLNFGDGLDLAVGIRYDHQKLDASTAGLDAAYKANEWQPRATLTKRWTPEFMTYASVARGVRGGGQNGPGAPNLTYRGDSVWTYEVGSKASALNGRLTANVAAFYNDYKNFIGANALAPSTIRNPATGQPVGFVAINLNSGDVESYGAEAELSFNINKLWRVYANATLLHARVTDPSQFQAITGYAYPGNRILFVPDANYAVGTNVRLPFHQDQAFVFDANLIGKGDRTGGSLDAASVPVLEAYHLVNASLTWQGGPLEVGAFATNLFNEKYIETYLDLSLLRRAGLPAPLVSNLAIQTPRRRVGIRGTVRF
ncbi:TonB-dependent receptor [Sphingomonas rubra]|uniref:Iron complex outermembrane recepter protein n=1 Tax=Sphingomonas rubra TaxID=634430 RepID=A0A1I5QND1_9SPHN|nr:TonB-dependent receptor [Sphingomonas rubra]SFP47366.1 iron complex outermembrane recepter protein [Sphingomonas rubra]